MKMIRKRGKMWGDVWEKEKKVNERENKRRV